MEGYSRAYEYVTIILIMLKLRWEGLYGFMIKCKISFSGGRVRVRGVKKDFVMENIYIGIMWINMFNVEGESGES